MSPRIVSKALFDQANEDRSQAGLIPKAIGGTIKFVVACLMTMVWIAAAYAAR
jgi:hypothetical protein